jgi:hypothetical protein
LKSQADVTCRLQRDVDGVWRGRWLTHERMPVELIPQTRSGRSRPCNIKAVMISCAEREELRTQTLRNLSATDWGGDSVHVQLDTSQAERRQERQEQTACAALRAALNYECDYVLFLEDDLEFNSRLRHNLESWTPLLKGEVTLAGLYAPNIGWLQRNDREHWFIADPNTIYGSQAFLLSRSTAEYLIQHWGEVPGMQDIKMSRLAARLEKPIYYHAPSLVQHVGHESVWGGRFHQTAEYQRDFAAQV